MNVESIEKDFRVLVEGETDLLNLVVKLHFSIDKVLDKLFLKLFLWLM